jgi:hypothetical protein
MDCSTPTHLVDLRPAAHGPAWASWHDVVVRSAGFPASSVAALVDPALAAAADAAVLDPRRAGDYRAEYALACARLSAAVGEVARTPLFREAVAWQNPKLVRDCLDHVARGEPRNVRGRNHELTVASYLQRYGLKNDTIGFVGPVGWARWTADGPGLTMNIGPALLTRRRVYFEVWAIDTLARVLSADPRIRPWLVPRMFSAHRLAGSTLSRTYGPPAHLTPDEAELLSLVDGVRDLPEIAEELLWSPFPELGEPATLLAAVESLVARELVRLDLVGGIEAFPERTLRAKLERIADPEARTHGLGAVDRLSAARDRLSAAEGDVAVHGALSELAECFEELTGQRGERRGGQTYAGRTLVYLDTVRDLRVGLGPALRAELARPLTLLLDSARWLVAEIGARFGQLLREIYDRRCLQLGSAEVPLSAVVSLATPQLYYDPRRLAPLVAQAVEEFQRRWARVLELPATTDAPADPAPGEARPSEDAAHAVVRYSADIAAAVAHEFPVRAVPWITGIHHSPDIMLAARDPDAVERGEYRFVLGELHLAFNTMESRLFVEQHDDPHQLLAAAEADLGDRRFYAIPDRSLPGITSRVAPPSALLSHHYTYWTSAAETIDPPGPVTPAADLVVFLDGDDLMVRERSGTLRTTLLAMLGEGLSAASLNAFRPIVSSAHRPRVSVDRLVVARESWTFRASDLAWARLSSEADRFLEARRFVRDAGLPQRAFYKVPVEDKPAFVDFGSLAFLNVLAKAIRRSMEQEDGWVTLTEMLPDQDELWVRDASGARYTSELRMLTVDRATATPTR